MTYVVTPAAKPVTLEQPTADDTKTDVKEPAADDLKPGGQDELQVVSPANKESAGLEPAAGEVAETPKVGATGIWDKHQFRLQLVPFFDFRCLA